MAQQAYHQLLAKALEAERAYYELDNPVMTDADYDAIIRRLQELENENPAIKSPNSPTTRVGGRPVNTFAKIQFPHKMLSLKNAFTEADIVDYLAKTKAYAGLGWCVQPKLDGLTLVLFYEHGTLVKAATRGNGEIGEDVTLNAMTVNTIPVTIQQDQMIVRGEIVMHKSDFEALNAERADKGLSLYANARNVAAGSIRQKDPSVTASRKLVFYAYDIPGHDTGTEKQMLALLEKNGFTVPQTNFVPLSFPNYDDVANIEIQEVKKHEADIPYAIDGAVIKTDDRQRRAELGEGTHDPNWAIAFKFTPVEAVTTLKGVVWQVGRKGTLTPVAVLEPVDLCGTTVEHASLHNIDYIREMDLKLGDVVAVYKAAEIIPQLDHVVESMGGAPLPIPSLCPECGAALVRDGAALVCKEEECRAKIKAEIRYFVSRQAMAIRGIADAMVTCLVDHGKLHSPADLYKLTREDLMIPGLSKDLKASSILSEIEKSKQKPFDRVLCAIGIDGIGTTGATLVANHFGSMPALLNASIPEIMVIDGFAEPSAREIFYSIHSARKAALINELSLQGLQMEQERVEPVSEKLKGLSFCITGTLSQSRDQIKKFIEDNGGKFVTSLSSNTSYLVAGVGGGSKRAKAEKLGITIINEQQLKDLLCQ